MLGQPKSTADSVQSKENEAAGPSSQKANTSKPNILSRIQADIAGSGGTADEKRYILSLLMAYVRRPRLVDYVTVYPKEIRPAMVGYVVVRPKVNNVGYIDVLPESPTDLLGTITVFPQEIKWLGFICVKPRDQAIKLMGYVTVTPKAQSNKSLPKESRTIPQTSSNLDL